EVENDRGRGLVDLARLDADQPVLDLVDATDAVLPAELVELLDQPDALHRGAIKGGRDALAEPDDDLLGAGRRRIRVHRPLEDVARWRTPRILEHAGLDGATPEVLVDAVRALLGDRHRDPAGLRVVDLFLAAHVHPATQRRDDGELGRERADGEVETYLIVPLAGRAVGHVTGTFFARGVHEQLL